jgi:hypothetical protein
VYRERIDDARLVAVVEHVHHWLFASAMVEAGGPASEEAGRADRQSQEGWSRELVSGLRG